VSQHEPKPQVAEYFCLPVLLACIGVGSGLVAGLYWWLA